jgi:hypothetical protein
LWRSLSYCSEAGSPSGSCQTDLASQARSGGSNVVEGRSLSSEAVNGDVRVNLLQRWLARRAERKQELAAIAQSRRELTRAGDEPPKSMSDTVDDVAGTQPPLG